MPSLIATPIDPRLNNRFRLIFDTPYGPVRLAATQEIKLPDSEIAVEEIGEGGKDVNRKVSKGKRKVGDVTVKRVMASAESDLALEQWHRDCAVLDPSGYKRNGTLQELTAANAVLVERKLVGWWPSKIAGRTFTANNDGGVLYEEITFTVDDVVAL